MRLPFLTFQLSTADRTRMQVGQARLLVRCMAKRGLAVTVAGDYVVGNQRKGISDPFMWGGPFGTMPLDHAKRFGYKAEPGGQFAKGPGFYYANPSHVFPESHGLAQDPERERAFYGGVDGVPDRESKSPACLDEVESAIGQPWVDLIDLEADLSQLAREHTQVERAKRSWIGCMNQRGYHYKDVWEASADFSLPRVSPRQVKVATDDVECTAKSGWANYYYAVLADYQRQSLANDPGLHESALAAEKARLVAIERELTRVD